MDVGSLVISTILFAIFVPGVVMRVPKGASSGTVLVVHAVLFAIVASMAMMFYWGARESFGNFGPKCPNGYRQTSDEGCVPAGHQTYTPGAFGEKTD